MKLLRKLYTDNSVIIVLYTDTVSTETFSVQN